MLFRSPPVGGPVSAGSPVGGPVSAGSPVGGPGAVLARGRFELTNPARDAALAACHACRGDWGVWGLAGLEACNCRTSDAHRTCRDADECEGDCAFERFEVVQTARPLTCRNGSCSVRFATGRPVGRCSDHRMTWGCKTVVPSGASRADPVMLPAHASSICVD